MAVLGKNPLTDVRAYRNPEIAMKGGKFIYSKTMMELSRCQCRPLIGLQGRTGQFRRIRH